uniref:Uncharacterized protein n=1 Tax=Cacopsylla melanoneura TaxID=428564 RepID=A0A8D9E5T1_9HEMI
MYLVVSCVNNTTNMIRTSELLSSSKPNPVEITYKPKAQIVISEHCGIHYTLVLNGNFHFNSFYKSIPRYDRQETLNFQIDLCAKKQGQSTHLSTNSPRIQGVQV